ncbi:hypothetical protein [Thalassoglobus polymorphus]|uniref:Uncharacterized protein n=1 Tax=Thalassoglobus polymorphus TaxID=2527994 RepID=A0A517QHW3_9PLAN|nr:hypothetical protein [Thalassoglobus polymorphus]QDT31147.1 hypothetical protein Mal48_03780 [Thalassoglobus polymorphus]
MLEENEDKVSLGLLVIGSVILCWAGVSSSGVEDGLIIILVYGLYTLLSVVAGVAAAFITAAIMKVSFGVIGSAVLRLAATIVFSTAIAETIPFGGLLSLITYFGLLMWFFELELFEVIIFAVILSIMRLVVSFALAVMPVSMMA